MFDIGATELLVIAIVAILVIGPKDMPLALRTAGRWIGKIRRVSAQFRSGMDAMVREAELQDMDEKWKKQNAEIMAKYPADPGNGTGEIPAENEAAADGEMRPLAGPERLANIPPEPLPSAAPIDPASAEAAVESGNDADEPQLPLRDRRPQRKTGPKTGNAA